MKRIYFCDFDGTITKEDTCDAMVKTFAQGPWQESVSKWQRGEITTIECSREIFRQFPVLPHDLASYLETIPYDDTFPPFTKYVEDRGEKLYILSDGFQFNINIIMKRAGLSGVNFYSNQLIHHGEQGWNIVTPYHSEACGKCGVCKKQLILSLKSPGYEIIYIGDGHSDLCACQEAHIVFAKGYLLEFCQEQQLTVHPFQTFADITSWLEKNQ